MLHSFSKATTETGSRSISGIWTTKSVVQTTKAPCGSNFMKQAANTQPIVPKANSRQWQNKEQAMDNSLDYDKLDRRNKDWNDGALLQFIIWIDSYPSVSIARKSARYALEEYQQGHRLPPADGSDASTSIIL